MSSRFRAILRRDRADLFLSAPGCEERTCAVDRSHDNRYRYYDPSVGRYISADPIGQFGLQASHRIDSPIVTTPIFVTSPTSMVLDNGYLYAFANPVRFVDHRGEIAHIAGGVAGGALVGGVVGSAVSVARAFAIQSAQGNIRSGQLLGAAITGFGIGAVAGGVAGGALASGQFGVFVPAARQVGVGSAALFRLGFSAAVQSPRVPGFFGALAGGLFSSPQPANACTNPSSGPPGGNNLHGQFLGGFGALNRR